MATPMTQTVTDDPSPLAPALPTHACVRCGADCPIDVALCESCNPLGLSQPAATQAHGTVFLAIIAGVVILAIAGRLALSGIGPFEGAVAGVQATPPYLTVTLSVTNRGTRAGATTCRIFDPSLPGIGPESTYVTSPRVGAGQTMSFEAVVTTLGSVVRELSADCQS